MKRALTALILAGLAFGLILGSAPMSAAQDAPGPEQLESLTKAGAEARRKEAELAKRKKSVQGEISKLKKDLVRTASESQSFEKEGRSIEAKLSAMEIEAERLDAAIYGDRQALMQLLAALQRIENNPPPPLATNPSDAVRAARAATLAAALSSELKTRADTLAQQLSELKALRADMAGKRDSLEANSIALNRRRARINAMVKQKSDLEQTIAKDKERASKEVKRLTEEAKTLRELIESFEAATAELAPRLKPNAKRGATSRKSVAAKPVKLPKGVSSFAKAKGKLRAPVQGRVTRQYGSGEKGITMKTRASAQVIAPYAGRIEFAGAFKNYDNVVILNVGGGYFILLTGIGETYVETGENILIGEPLGLMPFNGKDGAELYIEFRKNGGTINPKPWLGAALATG